MSESHTPAPKLDLVSNGMPGSVVNGRRSERLAKPGVRPAPSPPSRSGRSSGLSLIGVATLLGVGALALGGWAFVRQHRTTTPVPALPADTAAPLRRAVTLLASPRSEHLPLARSAGRLVVVLDERGSALLVVRNLGRAPTGLAYEAWVIPQGAKPAPAALFGGGADRVLWLRGRVGHGARVAVTLEDAGGVSAPTRRLRLVARRA